MDSFLLFFAIKPCRHGGSKSEKRYQDAFNNAYVRVEHATFRVQVGVCLSLELCFYLGGSIFQKNERLKLDWVEKSREMKGAKNRKEWKIRNLKHQKIKGASRPAHVQIIRMFTMYFAYLLCGPDAARRHSEAHPTRKGRFLLNAMKHRFARMCFLLERGVHLIK